MRMSRTAYLLLLLCPALPARADDQSRLDEAREVIRLSHAADHMRTLLPVLTKQLRPMLLQQSGSNTKLVDDFLAKTDQRFLQGTDGFVDLAAQVYAREFSDDDLKAFIAFYKTDAGQHLVDKQVVISAGMMAVGQKWGVQIAQDILKEFKQRQQTGTASKL